MEAPLTGVHTASSARDLTPLFDPASVAVVGASADVSKWGGDVAARLVAKAGDRKVFLVNRRGGEMHGRVAFPSLGDLPEAPELVVLAMPAIAFEETVDEALALGAKAFVAIFAGLGETGPDGLARERAVAARVRRAGALLLGPNCMGLADHGTGFEAVAYLDIPPGVIGFASQSGAMGEEFVVRARAWGCGFSRYVTLGNQADVTAAEVLEGFADHDATKVVALYVEDFLDGRCFADAAAGVVAAGRPVVLLTPGRSPGSVRAARSHTGSLASDDTVVDAVCRATGAIRVATPRELFEVAVALALVPRPRGRRVAVVTEGGGHGGIAADALAAAGLEVPEFDAGLVGKIRAALPQSAGVNPVDFAIGTTEPDAYARVLPALAAAGRGQIDAVLAVGQLGYWAARFPDYGELVEAEVAAAEKLAAAARWPGLPLVACTVYPDSAPAVRLRSLGVPVYREIGSAATVLAALAESALARPTGVPPDLPAAAPLPFGAEGYWQARGLLADAGLRLPPARLVTVAPVVEQTVDEVVRAARELGFPVVVKALGLSHKSDAGGVALGLAEGVAVRDAARRMLDELRCPGLVVERQAPVDRGLELIVGCRRDPRFGPVALVGLGGLYVEAVGDVCAALAPLTDVVAAGLFGALGGAALLGPLRGRPALDVAAAAAAAAALSRFAAAHPEVAEVEVNPLLVLPEGALALDARIVLARDEADPDPEPEPDP